MGQGMCNDDIGGFYAPVHYNSCQTPVPFCSLDFNRAWLGRCRRKGCERVKDSTNVPQEGGEGIGQNIVRRGRSGCLNGGKLALHEGEGVVNSHRLCFQSGCLGGFCGIDRVC